MGCGHSDVKLRGDQLGQLASFSSKGSVTLSTEDADELVDATRAPELVLRRAVEPHSGFGGPSDLILRAPLQRFRFEPSRVVLLPEGPPGEAGVAGLQYRGPHGEYDVPVAAIDSGEIVLDPPLEEPRGQRWGVGASIAGPSRLISLNLEFRFSRYFAAEVGAFTPGPIGPVWTGAKVISPRVHRVALFAGGFAAMLAVGESSQGAGIVGSYGVRFGLELMLRSWADALSVEVDFLRQQQIPHSTASFQGCRDGAVCPFGGASYVHFF